MTRANVTQRGLKRWTKCTQIWQHREKSQTLLGPLTTAGETPQVQLLGSKHHHRFVEVRQCSSLPRWKVRLLPVQHRPHVNLFPDGLRSERLPLGESLEVNQLVFGSLFSPSPRPGQARSLVVLNQHHHSNRLRDRLLRSIVAKNTSGFGQASELAARPSTFAQLAQSYSFCQALQPSPTSETQSQPSQTKQHMPVIQSGLSVYPVSHRSNFRFKVRVVRRNSVFAFSLRMRVDK